MEPDTRNWTTTEHAAGAPGKQQTGHKKHDPGEQKLAMNEPRVREGHGQNNKGCSTPSGVPLYTEEENKNRDGEASVIPEKSENHAKSRAEPTRRRGLRIKQIMEPI